VVQEALLRAWTRRRDFDSVVHWRRWLFCVARNLCIDTLRARDRVAPAGLLLDEGLPSDDGASMDREIESRRVQTAFASLQPRQQELLYLHDVVGVAYAELGAKVGVSTGCARAAVFRARGSLRRRLGALRAADA
jgi:RNA polymerase sigma-70 factor (ECF subfamily)